jgi:hypothetical protein
MHNTYRVKVLEKCGFSLIVAQKIDSYLLERLFIRELKNKLLICEKQYKLNELNKVTKKFISKTIEFENFHYTHLITTFCCRCKKYYSRIPFKGINLAIYEIDELIKMEYDEIMFLRPMLCDNCKNYIQFICTNCKNRFLYSDIKNICMC